MRAKHEAEYGTLGVEWLYEPDRKHNQFKQKLIRRLILLKLKYLGNGKFRESEILTKGILRENSN